MRTLLPVLMIALLALTGCPSGDTDPTDDGAATGADEAATEGGDEAADDEGEGEEAAPEQIAEAADEAPAEDSLDNGVFSSPQFNVRFRLPDDWSQTSDASAAPAGLGASEDSLMFVGPDDSNIFMMIANTQSLQLADASFNNLTETLGFTNVRIHPDRSQQRTFNGIPGYRNEADAMLTGDPVPLYLITQVLELPGSPTVITMFIPGDQYYLHSDTMIAVLDSVEVLDLRAQ